MEYYELYESEDYDNPWWDEDGLEMESIICPVNEGHRRGGPRLSKLKIIFQSKKLQDIMWTVYGECIITDRVARLFQRNGLSGYAISPVEAMYKKGIAVNTSEIPRYWELHIHGWGGMANPKSGIRLIESCEACGHLVYKTFDNPSALLDISQWDGGDIFMIWPLPGYIFVTQRVKSIIESESITGCKFIPTEALLYGPTHNRLGTLIPGRLKYWMPEERARELGEPLGIY